MKRNGGWRMANGGWGAALCAIAFGFIHPTSAIAHPPSFMDRLLGLRRLTWGDADATLGWEHPLPAWLWTLAILGACALAGWSYSRLLGPRGVRIALAGVRAALILTIAVLLAGPTLIDPQEKEEPDVLVVLVDRSSSMRIEDTPAGDGSGAPISREEALRRAILAQREVFGEEGLGLKSRQVTWLGFGDQVFEAPPMTNDAAWAQPQLQPDGATTALRSALEHALRVSAGKPLAGIVVFSDGRTPQSTGAELVRQIASRGAAVHVVPLGAAEPPFDLAVAQVEAPQRAFAKDIVPITVRLTRQGADDALQAERLRVRLLDEAGQVLDEQTPADASLTEPVRLTARSDAPGKVRYRVEVTYDAPRPEDREVITSNNASDVVVEVIDRPIRVLYVDGYPRWEYRYLKNTLIREQSIDCSTLLLSADRAFAQEGDTPIARAPLTAEELRPYDVVILGDVPPSYFTAGQLTLIRDHVVSGAGLLWIGGSAQTPRAYAGTELEDLLPMRAPAGVGQYTTAPSVDLRPTPLAEALQVLQLRGVGEAADADWPTELSPLRWVQDMGELKPTAEVLANAPGIAGPGGEPLPLIARLRYGGGQSIYVATDETWRWRYGRGELFFDQFWVQLIRMLGRARVQETVDRARLTVSHRQVTAGGAVVVELTVEDPAILSRRLSQITVEALKLSGGAGGELAVDQVVLRPVSPEGEEEPGRSLVRQVYRAVWRPQTAGDLVLRVADPALAELDLRQGLDVMAADDELRQVAPDHERLAALAAATGGQVVPLDELNRLAPAVPNLAEKTATDARESLWNSALALSVVLVLLTTEWLVRKMVWLV